MDLLRVILAAGTLSLVALVLVRVALLSAVVLRAGMDDIEETNIGD